MHVLVIAQLFPPDGGGASTRAYNVVKGIVKKGHSVVVVSAFPHYPHGHIPDKYRKRILYREIHQPEEIEIIRTWVPALPSKGFSNRLLIFFIVYDIISVWDILG